MFDRDEETKARDTLIGGPVKTGCLVMVAKGVDVGIKGRVLSITDDGLHDVAKIKLEGPYESNAGLPPPMYRTQDLMRIWPGLEPEDHPVGGWKKLLDKQAARAPQPCAGQRVRNTKNQTEGVTTLIEKGRVEYRIPNIGGHPVSERYASLIPPTDKLAWALPSDLVVWENVGVDGKWTPYADDVTGKPATPIRDLPAPFCNIRILTPNFNKLTWTARDESGKPITDVNENEAYNLAVQLHWELGL